MSERSSSNTSWRGNFFLESSECRPRIYDWMRFDLKNVSKNCTNRNLDSLNIDPEWMTTSECDVIDLDFCYIPKRSNTRSCVTRSSSKVSYDSTGPNDERYYVSPPSQSSSTSCRSSIFNIQKTTIRSKNEPKSLPISLNQRISSKSSPSLAVTQEEDEEEDEQPLPDHQPRTSNETSQQKNPLNVWANSNRYKGSLENVLEEEKSNVRNIAGKIQNLSEQDINRRKEREKVDFQWDENPHVKFIGFEKVGRPSSKAKSRPIISDQVYNPQSRVQHQHHKIPNEYEDFRKLSSRLVHHPDFTSVRNPLTKTLSVKKTENVIEGMNKPQQQLNKEKQRCRNLSTSDGNSRRSSSIESWPLEGENDPEETYSVILGDKEATLPPPAPFASLPQITSFYGPRNDVYFRRRHGYDFQHQSFHLDEKSLLSDLLRSSPPPISPPGFDKVQEKQSHFFNSLFPSRANRFGFPVYPERQFGIPSSVGLPVSFAGFSPDLRPDGIEESSGSSPTSEKESHMGKRKKKSFINRLKGWIEI